MLGGKKWEALPPPVPEAKGWPQIQECSMREDSRLQYNYHDEGTWGSMGANGIGLEGLGEIPGGQ